MSHKTMFKVCISDSEGNEFETNMPLIPRIGESIGYWYNDKWQISIITQVIYEFDQTGSYILAEINV